MSQRNAECCKYESGEKKKRNLSLGINRQEIKMNTESQWSEGSGQRLEQMSIEGEGKEKRGKKEKGEREPVYCKKQDI